MKIMNTFNLSLKVKLDQLTDRRRMKHFIICYEEQVNLEMQNLDSHKISTDYFQILSKQIWLYRKKEMIEITYLRKLTDKDKKMQISHSKYHSKQRHHRNLCTLYSLNYRTEKI